MAHRLPGESWSSLVESSDRKTCRWLARCRCAGAAHYDAAAAKDAATIRPALIAAATQSPARRPKSFPPRSTAHSLHSKADEKSPPLSAPRACPSLSVRRELSRPRHLFPRAAPTDGYAPPAIAAGLVPAER